MIYFLNAKVQLFTERPISCYVTQYQNRILKILNRLQTNVNISPLNTLKVRRPSNFQGIQGANIDVRLESIQYFQDTVLVLGHITGDWTLRK